MVENCTPIVLTYKNHNYINIKLVIHIPCLLKHIIPLEYTDQLAHVVIQYRILRLVKTTKY